MKSQTRNRNMVVVATAFGLVVLVAPAAFAGVMTFTTDDGAGADAFIFGPNPAAPNDPDDNWGDQELLVLKNDEGPTFSHTRKVYFRFDVSSLPPVPILSASLTLTAVSSNISNGATYTFDIDGLNDGHAGEAWVEGNGEKMVSGNTPPNPITWLNAPGHDAANGGVLVAQTTFIDSFQITNSLNDGDPVVVSDTDLVSFLEADTDGLITFLLTKQSTGNTSLDNTGHFFAAREHSVLDPPTLEITQVPEPTSIVLLVIGLIATVIIQPHCRKRAAAE